MDKTQIFFDIFLFVLTLLFVIITWNTDIALEIQYIPTILNGLISAISIMMGFSATAFAIMFSRTDFKPLQNGIHTKAIITLLIFPIFLSFLTYMELLRYANFQRAFKFAAIGLIVSFSIFTEFFVLIIGILEKMGRTDA